MGIILSLSALGSRVERKLIAGQNGIRTFSQTGLITKQARSGGQETFWDGLARFGASILALATWKPSWLNFSFANIWSNCVNAYHFVWNFNINATDQQLDAQIKQQEIAIAAAKGTLRGTFVGKLICGIAPTATIAVFNEALALYLLEKVGEEAAREVVNLSANLIRLQNRQIATAAFYNLFKSNRAILRAAVLDFAKALQFFKVPFNNESIEKANKQRDQPWSLGTALTDSIEKISDPAERIEATEFWQQFGSSCIEAGYIIAHGLDSWILEQRAERGTDAPTDEDIIIINPAGALPETIIP